MQKNSILRYSHRNRSIRFFSSAVFVVLMVMLSVEAFGCYCGSSYSVTTTSTSPANYCPGDLVTVTTTVSTYNNVGTYPDCTYVLSSITTTTETTTASTSSGCDPTDPSDTEPQPNDNPDNSPSPTSPDYCLLQ